MGKTGEDAEKMKKKSKKNKNMTNDLLEEKGHKHRERKRKSESNEDGDENRLDKDNLVNDRIDSQQKKKIESKDGDEVRQDKVTLANDRVNSQKKRKREIKQKDLGRKDGPAVERDCDVKLGKKKTADEKEKKKKEKEKEKGKKKEKKKTDDQDSDVEITGIMTEESTIKTSDRENKKGKKKTNDLEKEKVKDKGSKVKNKTNKTNKTEKPKAKGKSKKVSFSGDVEVFPAEQTTEGDGLVRGKRFTPEEDAIVKEAVLNYITAHDLGDDGLKMVLNCSSHKGMKKCWQDIGTCIPYRPYTAVYYRAHILFERGENRSWTPEEIAFLKESHEKHGNKWKMVAEELGKHRFHVKDTWRRIKLDNLKEGKWSQEEYQNLYDLVNMDLIVKVNGQEKRSKHGMLRDNIPWTTISEKLTTRSDATCCTKWYKQLTSSLVIEKKWCDADDYRMIGALYELDAACLEDVDWDNLLEHRPGDICLKRWNQMVKHIGNNRCLPFAEQVDTLAKRYCPDLAETRDAWDNQPVVP